MILGSPELYEGLPKDDEDEGFLPQGRANPGEIMPGKNRMSSGCPPGMPHPAFFPSEYNPAHNALRVTRKTKSGKRHYVIASEATRQSLGRLGDCFAPSGRSQ
jgi:hypothetical protein